MKKLSCTRDSQTASMFGDQLLPEVGLPSVGHMTAPQGEWVVYCPRLKGFNAVMPASWSAEYSGAPA